MGLEDDRSWLDAFRRGERAALARVFEEYGDDVARTIRSGTVVRTADGPLRVGGNLLEADVEALVHDTFIKAFAERARNSYDGIRPFGAWLATIARNVLLDFGRAQSGKRHVAIEIETLADPGPNQEDVVATHELRSLLGRFLLALDELDRGIFKLRFAQSRSRRDAGEVLGLSEMQVRRRDVRMKRDLVSFLRKNGAPVPDYNEEDVS